MSRRKEVPEMDRKQLNAEAVGLLLREIASVCKQHQVEVDFAYRSGWYEGVLLAIAHGIAEPKAAAKRGLERFGAWQEMTPKPRRKRK